MNSFIAGKPVSGDKFFGRSLLLKKILSVTLSQQAILLIGTRRIGKSSLLAQTANLIRQNGLSDLIVRIDGSIIPDVYGFATDLASGILHQIEGVNSAERFKSAVILDNLNQILNADRNSILFKLRSLIRSVEESNIQITVLIDEMDVLLDTKDNSSVGTPALIRHLASSREFSIVCAAFKEPQKIDSTYSPWYNVFQIQHIGLFTTNESLEMLTALSEQSGSRFSDQECNFLIELFGNFPFYLQSAGHEIFTDPVFPELSRADRKEVFLTASNVVARNLKEYHLEYLLQHLQEEDIETLFRVASNKKLDKSDGGVLYKLHRFGYLASEHPPLISSRIIKEFFASLPQESFLQKAGRLKIWQTLQSTTWEIFKTAATKSIEIAASKYL